MLSVKDVVRTLRRNQTAEEKTLWNFLRNRRFNGKKIRRQFPIIYTEHHGKRFFFVADFYCAESKLVIELDGKIHDFKKEYDMQRDLIIKELNLKIVRIRNEELKEQQLVLNKILEAM